MSGDPNLAPCTLRVTLGDAKLIAEALHLLVVPEARATRAFVQLRILQTEARLDGR